MSKETLPMLLPMDRRMALKVMAVAAATPGLASCGTGTQEPLQDNFGYSRTEIG